MATVRDVQLAAMNSEMMPQPAPISSVLAIRFGSMALMLRMKNSELEIREGMIDTSRHIDDQAVGMDSLRDRLAADKRLMRRLDVETLRIHQIGQAELSQDGQTRSDLDLIFYVHLLRLYWARANFRFASA